MGPRHNQKQNPKLVLRNKEFIDKEKNKPCIDCGKQLEHSLMHFDHIDPKKKKFNLASARHLAYSIETITNEISKCVIRCFKCHIRKSKIEKDYSFRKNKTQIYRKIDVNNLQMELSLEV